MMIVFLPAQEGNFPNGQRDPGFGGGPAVIEFTPCEFYIIHAI
jgi:hypothetical protein